MGWADGVDQGITCFFLQAFALRSADNEPKGGVFADQGAVGPWPLLPPSLASRSATYQLSRGLPSSRQIDTIQRLGFQIIPSALSSAARAGRGVSVAGD